MRKCRTKLAAKTDREWERVYLSGPITLGNKTFNFAIAAEAHRRLMLAGYAVLNPMLTMMHPDEQNIPWDVWLKADLAWVAVADKVIRLPGESKGATRECNYARMNDVPVIDAHDLPILSDLFDSVPHQASV